MIIDVSGMLKSPIIIVLLSVSPFMSVNICFMYLGAPGLGAYTLTGIISCSCISLYHYIMSFFFVIAFVLKSILSDMNITASAFLSFLFA